MNIAYWRLQILGCLLVVGIVMPLTVLAEPVTVGGACVTGRGDCSLGVCSVAYTCFCTGVGTTAGVCALRVAVGGACSPTLLCQNGLTCTESLCVASAAPPSCPCTCAIQTSGGQVSVAVTVMGVGTATGPASPEDAQTSCQALCQTQSANKSGTSFTATLGACPASLFDAGAAASDIPAGGGDAGGGSGSVTLYNPLGADVGVAEFVGRGIKAVIGIIGAFALLMFIYGGVMWMTAGDSKRVDSAKEILKNSTIGLLLIFFSYSIVTLVFSLLGGTV